MEFKTIFQEEHCEVTQIGTHALKIKFSGFLKVTNLASLTTFMDTFTKNNPCDLLLIDQSGLKVLSREVQTYLAKVVSIISEKGITRMAFIEADDIFAKAGVDKLQKGTHADRITRVVFHSEKAALEWLLSPAVASAL